MPAVSTSTLDLGAALGIGLLVGLERERRKGEGPTRGAAGIRTFALVALLGGVCMQVGGQVALGVGAAFTAALAIVSQLRTDNDDPGVTTEVALVVAFMLGALAQSETKLAVGTGVVVAILLASRSRLHTLVKTALTEQELHDGLLLAAAAVVVLPILPDQPFGPGGAINPFTVWRLVVIVMLISAAGYVALRTLGPRVGLPITGFASGFVSSAATIGAMASRAGRDRAVLRPAVAGAVASTVATFVLMALILGSVSGPTLRVVTPVLLLGGFVATVAAGLVGWHAAKSEVPGGTWVGRAFDLRTALAFAIAVTIISAVSSVLRDWLGNAGVSVTAGVAGFADTHAASASVASLVATGHLQPRDAVLPIMLALTANTVTKVTVATVAGGRGRFAVTVGAGLLGVIAAAWVGAAIALVASPPW